MSDPRFGRRLEALARKVRRARALSARQVLDVLRAGVWIAFFHIGLRLWPYPDLIRRFDRGLKDVAAGRPSPSAAAVERIAAAVDIAARNSLPPAKCLSRSLALRRMLRAAGFEADVRIGVARPGDAFEAHAWVEVEGRVVNDAPDIAARFHPLEQAADLARLRLRDVASRRPDSRTAPLEGRP